MRRNPIVYLAGAIAGITGSDATDWRVAAGMTLAQRYIDTLDPMRAKLALSSQAKISTNFHDYEHNGAFFTSRGIMVRDSTDVRRCDALLVNLLGLTKPSLGTIMELAWAYILNKPAVVAIEKSGNPHDNHPMIHEAMPFRVETLDEAIDAVAVILGR
jgi:nucleoside 2-deoxyribosyltransferase